MVEEIRKNQPQGDNPDRVPQSAREAPRQGDKKDANISMMNTDAVGERADQAGGIAGGLPVEAKP